MMDVNYEARKKNILERELLGEDVSKEIEELEDQRWLEEVNLAKRNNVSDFVRFAFKTRPTLRSGALTSVGVDAIVQAYYTAKRLRMIVEKDDVKDYEKKIEMRATQQGRISSPIIERQIAQYFYKPTINLAPVMDATISKEAANV